MNSWRLALRAVHACGLAAVLGLSLPLYAVPTLDLSFGTNGTASNAFPADGGSFGQVVKVAATRDNRLLAWGLYYAGHTATGDPIYGQVMGLYGSGGVLDAAFGTAGFINWPYPPLVQRDNKIVGVAPISEHAGLARLNSDGSVDAGFVTDGASSLGWFSKFEVHAQVQQADGRIVLVGNVNGLPAPIAVLIRFNADGTLDLGFNHSGAVTLPRGQSMYVDASGLAIQQDGKLVVAATSEFIGASGNPYFALSVYRYNGDGTPDASFGADGVFTFTAIDSLGQHENLESRGLVATLDGRLIVYGSEARFLPSNGNSTSLLLGLSPSGVIDTSFGFGGAVRGTFGDQFSANDVLVQPDGKLLVALNSDATQTAEVIRLGADGSTDAAFGNAGVLSSPNFPIIHSLALQADGDLVLGGATFDQTHYAFALQRYVSAPTAAIEYYNAPLDHYFITMNPQEVGDLDAVLYPGWTRTGLSFLTYGSAASAAGTSAGTVCRFYIPPQHGNSHFFSVDPVECAIAATSIGTNPDFSGYVEETPNAFYINLPDKATGACPASTISVYRLWNHLPATNHRYTTSAVVKNQMIENGWVAEGHGPNAVGMCAPQ